MSFEFSNSCGLCIRFSASLGVYYTVKHRSAFLNTLAAFLKWTLPPRLPSLLQEAESREQLAGSWTFLMGTVKFAGLLLPKINSKMYLRLELSRFYFLPRAFFQDLDFFPPSYIVIKAKIVDCQGELTACFFNEFNQICHSGFGSILNGTKTTSIFQNLERCCFWNSDFY